MTENAMGRVGGWAAPCAAFDYGKMEREAQRECGLLKGRLQALKEQETKDAEQELLRRREVCLLTDIYYEQRHNAQLFRQRAQRRGQAAESPLLQIPQGYSKIRSQES